MTITTTECLLLWESKATHLDEMWWWHSKGGHTFNVNYGRCEHVPFPVSSHVRCVFILHFQEENTHNTIKRQRNTEFKWKKLSIS